MTKQELSDLMGNNQFATITYNCHDCKQPGNITAERTSETEIKITGGAIFKPPENWRVSDSFLAKCQECFDAERSFKPETEVYSRVVGYLRPIKNWNQAKKTEYDMRKEYKI